MATISKFYLHNATSPNTATMPSAEIINVISGDATGARTARDATGTIGTLQTSSLVTATADQNLQSWGHRRFVSRPLATQTYDNSGTWTFSYARDESNLLHNQQVTCVLSIWRPSLASTIPSSLQFSLVGTEPTVAATVQAESVTFAPGAGGAWPIVDGDVLHIEFFTQFTQGMSVAYTEDFFYDGTTEASTTSCASFVLAPLPMTLLAPTPPRRSAIAGQAVNRAATWMKRHSGIVVPRLWTPADPVPI